VVGDSRVPFAAKQAPSSYHKHDFLPGFNLQRRYEDMNKTSNPHPPSFFYLPQPFKVKCG
jgi:hypothetical protein